MKLTVLNSGSSGNGYILEGRHSALIIECGVAPRDMFRATSIKVSKIAGVLVTHEHMDHSKYIDRYATMGLPIFASAGTIAGCDGIHPSAIVRKVRTMDAFKVGEFDVCAFDVEHDAAEPLGFIIKHPECGKILFMTDSAGCKYDFHDMELDHLLIEANYDDGLLNGNIVSGLVSPSRAVRTRKSHFSIRQACQFIQAVQTAELKTVVLIHLSRDNGNAVYFARKASEVALFADIYVAAKGTSIELNKNANFAVL